jgi:hypothetical protein
MMHKLRALLLATVTCTFFGGISIAAEPAATDTKTNEKVSSAASSPDQLPAKVDLRPELKKYELTPRSQGHRNTCSVFTTAAAMEFAMTKHSGKSTKLSPEYMNWATNRVIRNRSVDRGQFFHDLIAAYEKFGVCLEEQMPYQGKFDPQLIPLPEARAGARELGAMNVKFHWITPISKDQGLSEEKFLEVKKVLASGYPVAAGSDHSRLLVGYVDDAQQPGGGVFLTKDSGIGRFSAVTYEFAKTKINDTFWVEVVKKEAK